ncbi:unnamed protein product [Chrysoparadoxa australica]
MADYGYGGGSGAYEPTRDDKPIDFDVVAAVKDFVFDLHDSMRRSHIMEELQVHYAITFPKLSEEYYKTEPWPAAEVISNQCGDDELFLLFYKEMRLRHICTNLNPSIQDRFEAWANYCCLFDMMLDCHDTDFLITSSWAFDIMHEFLYQFQSFCQFRTSLDMLNETERSMLMANQDVWAVQNVMSYLHGLTRVSNIVPILAAKRNPSSAAPSPVAPSQMHELCGYFAIVSMSRLQCLLGDYYECLNVLKPLDVTDKNELFASILGSYMSLYLHMSLSFLMLRRYRDASRTLNEVLVHTSRAMKAGQAQRAGTADMVSKQFDKMLGLLAISQTLAPGLKIDESISQLMKEKHKDKLAKMEQGSEAAFRELFQWVAPKFIVPGVPDYSSKASVANSAIQQQLKVFCEDVRLQLLFPQVRSYLQLYTTISMEKMSRFNNMSEEQFGACLTSMKHILTQPEWKMSGERGPLDGKPALGLDFNYYVEEETLVIDEQERVQQHEGFFMSQIDKCESFLDHLEKVKI